MSDQVREMAVDELLFFDSRRSALPLYEAVRAGLLEPVILNRKQDQVAVVRKSSYKGCRHLLIVQNIDP